MKRVYALIYRGQVVQTKNLPSLEAARRAWKDSDGAIVVLCGDAPTTRELVNMVPAVKHAAA